MKGQLGTCDACTAIDREAIDDLMIVGVPLREIEGKYGIPKSVLGRHRQHLPALIAQTEAGQAMAEKATASLPDKIAFLEKTAQEILTEARTAGDRRLALQAIDRLARLLEVEGRVSGEIEAEQQTTVNMVVMQTEWAVLRTRVLQALTDFPDARLAVARALTP